MDQATVARAISECGLCPLHSTRLGIAVPSVPGETYSPGGIALMTDIVRDPADYSSGVPYAGGRNDVRQLESLLADAGLSKAETLLMFRVRCAPARGRIDDYPEAIFNCDTWTAKELEAYNPGVVVLMGGTALTALYGADAKVTQIRGKPRPTSAKHKWGQRVWVPTWHLYAGTRSTLTRQQTVRDLALAKEIRDDEGVHV